MPGQSLYRCASLRQIESDHHQEPLMQRAGEAAAQWARELACDRPGDILICVGPGNNGGDAFEAARYLLEQRLGVQLVAAPAGTRPAAAEAARHRFLSAGGSELEQIPPTGRWRLIIDGIFGIGLNRPAEGVYRDWINSINRLAKRDACPLLALDCPSGLNADTGKALDVTVLATHTLSFIAGKPGLFTADGPDHCGEIRTATLDLTLNPDDADGNEVSTALFAAYLQPRPRNSHKGSYGGAGILGGAHSMTGAVCLAGRAALKLGAGRVYVGLMAPEAPVFDPFQPELMMRRPDGLFGAPLTALACGPGMGTSLQATELLERALALDLPLVLDADALNLLACEGNLQTALATRTAPTILTPHPAEAARLLDMTTSEVSDDRLAAALEIANRFRSLVVLKGCGSLLAAPEGRWWINTTGNPGLATAGTGDVLTGFIVALLAQAWKVEAAALAAVHLHGAAADLLVAKGIGPIGLTANELIDAARAVLNRWIHTESTGECG